MRKVLLNGIVARKLRVALTLLSIASGVALVTGTYVLTDTIDRSFDRIFEQTAQGTDVSVTAPATLEGDGGSEGTLPTLPPAVVERVRAVPGVAAAQGNVFDQVTILGPDGERISTGSPNFASSISAGRFEAFTIAEGRFPRTDGEAAIDQAAAQRVGYDVGDRVRVVGDRGRVDLRLVGLTKFGNEASFGGASVVSTTLRRAQSLTGKGDGLDEIEVAGDGSVAAAELVRRVREELGRGFVVRTGQQQAAVQSADIKDDLGFIRTILLVFAGVSLFVGAFIIFNTFSITVAQRTREFALLRTLGASRRQILRSVLGEGLVLAVAGSAIGLALGLALAPALYALFKVVGAELPNQGLVILGRTVAIAVAVGLVVTLVSGLAPALRATRVSPMAALRETQVGDAHVGGRALVAALVLVAIGVGLLAYGLFGGAETNAALSLLGAGAVAVFLGVAILSPRLVPPLTGAIAALLRPFSRGVAAQLARENTRRQPGRTAATAAALMIGVALVAFVAIFANGIQGAIDNAVDSSLEPRTLIAQNTDGFSALPARAPALLADRPEVATVSPVIFTVGQVRGIEGTTDVTGVDPATFGRSWRTEWEQGSDATLRRLDARGTILTKPFAEENDLGVGDTLTIRSRTGERGTYTVRGIVDGRALFASVTLSVDVVRRAFGEQRPSFLFVGLRAGTDEAAAKRAIDRLLERDVPNVEALTGDEFREDQAGQINQLLVLVYVLLALATLISALGIVNTLTLSISERTRELGLLRAVGTTRRQVRAMVRRESVITSLIGAALGIVLGIFFAIAVSRPLADDGFVLTIPWVTLAVLLVLAAIAGTLAAILPARRAARTDVLRAIAQE